MQIETPPASNNPTESGLALLSTRKAARFSTRALTLAILAIVLAVSAVLRVAALGYDLPNIYHPDEPNYVNIVQRMIANSDLNPHFFNYPTLFFYLNLLAYLPFIGFQQLSGSTGEILPVDVPTMAVTHAGTPQVVLIGRGLSVIFGLGGIILLYLIGRRLTGSRQVGVLAALLMGLSPTVIKINRFVTPDTFVVFFMLAAVYFAVRIHQTGRTRDYLLAGLCVGMAASSKYNAGLAVMAPLIAHFVREGWHGFKDRRLYGFGLASAVGFLGTSPYILIDFPSFWQDFTYEANHYATGHPGMEGDTLNWYLKYLLTIEGAGMLLGAVAVAGGAFYTLVPKSNPDQRPSPGAYWTVFGLPVIYFVFISRFIVRNDRTLLPVIPFLLLAAAGLIFVCFRAASHHRGAKRAAGLVAGGVALLLSLYFPLYTLIDYAPALTSTLPLKQAQQWVADNLPPGTRIAVESYGPYLDPQRYQITPLFRAITPDESWYRTQGIEYVIFGEAMYGRFYCQPELYYIEMSQYNRLFWAFDEVAVFEDPHKVGPLDNLLRVIGDDSPCLQQIDFLYSHEVKIYRVR